MSEFLKPKSIFLTKVAAAIEEQLADEQFGVSELADKLHMSRSNLLRKVKQETGTSVSVYIRNVRLYHGQILLLQNDFTVSEVAYKVGFGNTSYFTKCYRELFGHTPGEAQQITTDVLIESDLRSGQLSKSTSNNSKALMLLGIMAALIIISGSIYYFVSGPPKTDVKLDKSIAVLPFRNDSPDSSNVYFMNGLMEAILHNFQKIEDLEIVSRTGVEHYGTVEQTLPELAEELGVSYFVEGSGQKVGEEILLNIQLIEASTNRQIWSKSYRRALKDVFTIQSEIAKGISTEINVYISPAEKERIDAVPTANLVAYDYYLNGLSLIKNENGQGFNEAVNQFKKAIAEDGEFAQAYAYVAICYYYLDIFQSNKQHAEQLKAYADKAIELQGKLGESLIAQALYFMQLEEYDQAINSFDEVLLYYPNVGWVHNFLSQIYANHLPNSAKYLQHAIRGIRAAVEDQDKVTASFTYLHLSNALAQNGFIKEAKVYAEKSLEYNPNNTYTQYLKVYLYRTEDFDLARAKKELLQILAKDTSRLDVLQEIARVCFTMADFEESNKYYLKLISKIEALQLNIYQNVHINIAFGLEQLGQPDEAKKYYESYFAYAQADESIYHDILMGSYYATQGDIDLAVKYLQAFSKIENIQYWLILFMDKDPVIRLMEGHPDYQPAMKAISDNFWQQHEKSKAVLIAEGIIEK